LDQNLTVARNSGVPRTSDVDAAAIELRRWAREFPQFWIWSKNSHWKVLEGNSRRSAARSAQNRHGRTIRITLAASSPALADDIEWT
jgi:hypothetical protein